MIRFIPTSLEELPTESGWYGIQYRSGGAPDMVYSDWYGTLQGGWNHAKKHPQPRPENRPTHWLKPVDVSDLPNYIFSVGLKKGQWDFAINGAFMNLSVDEMKEFRAMLVVAIGTAEIMFRDALETRTPGAKNAGLV